MWAHRLRLALFGGLLAVGAYFGERFVNPWQNRNDEYSEGIPAEQGRPDFRVCVDRIGDDAEPGLDDVALVRMALNQALTDAPYLPPFYEEHPAIIGIGCRSPMFLSDERIGFEDRHSLRSGQIVGSDDGRETMSPYKVSVYFTEPEAYAVAFGNAAYATSSEEYGCRGDVCQTVTGGIYAPDGDLAEEDLAFALRISLGLFSLQEARDWISQQD
jgi:hypothetical protein